MLGIMEDLRYHGLCHASATRTRRDSRRCVTRQRVLGCNEGQEETITDVLTLDKNRRRLAHLGLTLAEAPQLLSTLERYRLPQQGDTVCEKSHVPRPATSGSKRRRRGESPDDVEPRRSYPHPSAFLIPLPASLPLHVRGGR
jgi:hypothetical protein